MVFRIYQQSIKHNHVIEHDAMGPIWKHVFCIEKPIHMREMQLDFDCHEMGLCKLYTYTTAGLTWRYAKAAHAPQYE